MAKKETIKAENNKTHFDAMRARRKRLKQSSTSYLVSLNGIKTYWSTNRNETWFTELWEKRNEKNFQESFKEDFRVYPYTFRQYC